MADYSKRQGKLKRPVIDQKMAGQIHTDKQVKISSVEPLSYENYPPVWSFKRMQMESRWVFIPEHLLSHDDNCMSSQCVLSKLAEFEKMTWSEIKRQQHGKQGKSSSHFIDDLSKLCKDARRRLIELNITENFFSLRLEGRVRIFGVLESRVLEILWYDIRHEIYPID